MPKLSEIPLCPEPPVLRPSKRETVEYRISLCTPLFGGGVEGGIPDESLPIRGTLIRGHLQFWWRATRGAVFTTYQELFNRHAEIWGTTKRASQVEIDIREVKTSQARPCARYVEQNGKRRLSWEKPFKDSPLPYVLFPFQGTPPEASRFIEMASFTFRLRYPKEFQKDLEVAVWAWVSFGGLGARTRRGCGALFCEELAPKRLDDLQEWFKGYLLDRTSSAVDWPTMPSTMLLGNAPLLPLDAWNDVVGLLQMFRQGEGIARNSGARNRPGRSRYPEPETIRRVTRRRSAQHVRLAHIPEEAFPRAEFGLPIVFHFQGEREGEPPDTVLYPLSSLDGKIRERMASPLILKPLALANGKALPLIVRLVTRPLAGVVLKQGDTVLDLPEGTIVRDQKLSMYRDSPLHASPTGSAIEAFLFHAREHGFREIAQ